MRVLTSRWQTGILPFHHTTCSRWPSSCLISGLCLKLTTTTALLCLICRFCQHLCCCCLLPAFVFLYFGVFALPGAALETHAHKRPLIHLCHLKIAGWLQLPEIEDGVTLFFHWSHHQCWKCTASILWCSGLTLLDSYPGVTDMFSLALSVPVRKGFGRAVLNCKPDDKDYK